MQNKYFVEFTNEHKLEKSEKLLGYLIQIAIQSVKAKFQDQFTQEDIKQLSKAHKHKSDQKIREELEKIKKELGKLTKHFESESSLQNQENQLVVSVEPSQIRSQEQMRWWSSSPNENKINRSLEPAKQPKQRRNSLTPKVTECPAPIISSLQYRAQKIAPSKHHLDDSEIKKIWDSEQLLTSLECEKKIPVQKIPPKIPMQESIIESSEIYSEQQNSQEITESNKSAPKFDDNENKKINQNQKKLMKKENIKPRKHSDFRKKQNDQTRKTWQKQQIQIPTPVWKNTQSKIKAMVDHDRQIHKMELLQAQYDVYQQQILDYKNQLDQKSLPTFQTYEEPITLNSQELDMRLISNRNPVVSNASRPHFTSHDNYNTNELFENLMEQQQRQQNVDPAHIRYISSITSNNSAEGTPQQYIYNPDQNTAQSLVIQSIRKDKKNQSSGKVRFKSDAQVIPDTTMKFTEKKSQSLCQQEGYQQPNQSNHLIDIANSFLNCPLVKQLERINSTQSKCVGMDYLQFQNEDSEENGKKLKDVLSYHDYHSSISSNFSLFNPKDELKSFFQKEFQQRSAQVPGVQEATDINSPNLSFHQKKDNLKRQLQYDYS